MKDVFGLVPADIKARYAQQEMVQRCLGKKHALDRALHDEFGPHVDCVLIGSLRSREGIPDSVVPERWHVRVDRGAPFTPQFIPIVTESGGYREPGPDVIPMLARRDLRRSGVKEAMMERGRTDSPHKAAERALAAEQRRDVMKEDFRAAKRCTEGGLKGSYASKHTREKAKAT